MRIREAVYDNCGECGRSKGTLVEESFGCDNCKKPIDEQLNNRDNKHRHYLDLGIFYEQHDRETKHMQFCSWKCLLQKLPKIKTDYFITVGGLIMPDERTVLHVKQGTVEIWARLVHTGEIELEIWDETTMPEGSICAYLTPENVADLHRKLFGK